MDKVFKFYFSRDSLTYYYVDNQGIVQTSNIKRSLVHDPIDWKSASVSSKSSGKAWVSKREFSTPLKFVVDGAKILRHLFAQDGYMASCFLRIEKLNTYTQSHEYWHSGRVDFSKYEDEETTVSITLLEQGLVGLLKNRESIIYEIPFVSQDEHISLSGVKLKSRAEWILGDSQSDSAVDYTISGSGREISTPATQFGTNVQAGNFISPLSPTGAEIVTIYNTQQATPFTLDSAIAITASQWNDVNIYGRMPLGFNFETYSGTNNQFAEAKVKVWANVGRWDSNGFSSYGKYLLAESDYYPRNSWHYPYLILGANIPTIPQNQQIVISLSFSYRFSSPSILGSPDIAGQRVQFFANDSILDLKYNAKVEPSKARGIKYINFLKRLVEKMSDGEFTAVSDFLSNPDDSDNARFKNFDNSPYNTIVTSGDSLRSLPNALVKANFSDTASDLWSRYGLDWSVEGDKVRFEPIEYYFNNNLLFTIESVVNLRISPLSDRVFNDLSIGYSEQDNDMIDGRNEFNTKMNFLTTANKVIKSEEALIAPFKSAVYSIESVRVKTTGTDTKDNKYDNSVFVIELDPEKRRGGLSSIEYSVPLTFGGSQFLVEGVDDKENMYNIALSPKRALFRHIRRLRSIINKGILQYQTTERNPELESNLWAGYIKEVDDVNMETAYHVKRINTELFKPIVMEFECEPPYNLVQILDNSSRGYIRFKYGGLYYKGYVIDVGCTPATRDVYSFRLLCHADNDLSTIKRK